MSLQEQQQEAQRAFDYALKIGRLSLDEDDLNYVGDYMYMGKYPHSINYAFKHKHTRQYILIQGET